MQTKRNIPVQIKALAEDGSFEGDLAVYNNVDLGGDMIEPGAFAKTIKERGGSVPMLWQHNPDKPIGTLTLIDSPTALKVKGQLLMDLDDAKRAYILIKAKIIKGLSIGFDTIKDSVDDGVRRLKEVRLWEGSIVTFPMNELAMITSVKRAQRGSAPGEIKNDFDGELAEIQLQDVGFQMRCALFQSLGDIIWGAGLTKEDKVAAAQATIDQFSEAFMAYLPQYLDWLAAEYGDMELMGKLRMEEKSFASRLSRGAKGVLIAAPGVLELKEGRKFSAATLKTLGEAHEHVKGLSDIFDALFDDEADDDPSDPEGDSDESSDETGDDDTTMSKAAKRKKTEPEPSHSAAAEILDGLRSLIPKA